MMKRKALGKTGIMVSPICFGSLTMGPLQRHMSVEEGSSLISYAYEQGVNFIDTAELYETYAYIGHALKSIPRHDYVIASKSYAYSTETAKASLDKALSELGTDYVDIFMLHEQESQHTVKGHYEAIEYFLKMKEAGIIKAFGISTHYIEGAKAAVKYPEIEVLHPITNMKGLGIQDGTMDEMRSVLKRFKANGGGIYGMKPFGGGNLLHSKEACFDYVLGMPELDAIAVGMQSFDEIDYNVRRVQNLEISQSLRAKTSGHEKVLSIADWCIGCGNCVEKCDHHAMSLVEGMAVVNREKCVLCGYCSAVCPEFCIKVF